MLVIIILGLFAIVFSTLLALMAGRILRRANKENMLGRTFVWLGERWRNLFGAAGIVFGLLIIFVVLSGVNQPPAPCTPGRATVTHRPSELVSAQDYFAQGDYDYERGACDAAIEDYTRALELSPNLAEAYNNRAYTYMVQEDYSAALSDLNKAIELRPDYVNALMNRGDIHNYYYQIDYDLAIADYDRILRLRPRLASLCGHRLLALHHGWNLGVFVELFTKGSEAGCT